MYLSNDRLKDLHEREYIGQEADCVPGIIGASMSVPHTSVTSLHPCRYTCMFAWILLGPTTYCKSLLVLSLHASNMN